MRYDMKVGSEKWPKVSNEFVSVTLEIDFVSVVLSRAVVSNQVLTWPSE